MAKRRSAGLERLKIRFAAWRKKRVRGTRIPERLWDAAVVVAGEVGVCQTANSLHLDYYALQRRLEERAQQPASPAFMELSSPAFTTSECVIELEDACGASMRMHFKGVDMSSIATLGQQLWKG